jgi:hypothetical protein
LTRIIRVRRRFPLRFHLKLTIQSGINEAALRYQLLQLPGIQDLVFVTSAGSFMVYLYAISPVGPPSLLALANSTLVTSVAFPIQASALSPGLVGISLATTINCTAGTAPADQALVLVSAATAAANYINNHPAKSPFCSVDLAPLFRPSATKTSALLLFVSTT